MAWLRARQTVQTRLAILDTQLLGIATALQRADTKLDDTHRELQQHAERARTEVQAMREAGIKRGEQLDRLCRQHAWLQRMGTALLLAALIGLGGFLWTSILRTPSIATEHKLDRILEQLDTQR